MFSLCLYFKVHQPFQLKPYSAKEIGACHCYEDVEADRSFINTVADACYIPANEIILQAIKKHEGNFKVSYSFSGTLLELLQRYRPDVIHSFKELVDTGCVEILGETYYHSLSSLHSKKEFKRQVEKHSELVNELFGITPAVYRNTELIYNNCIAKTIAGLGFKGILCEGLGRILKGRTANNLYAVPELENDFSILLRNMPLSDDIAFRFAEENWEHYPLTSEKFASWIHGHEESIQAVNLFLDYETFGLHKSEQTGILNFLKALPDAILENKNWKFSTPSEVIDEYYPTDIYDVPETISWKDQSRASCVWCENMMQNNTLKKIYSLENMITQTGDEKIFDIWGRLQEADYFYYMGNAKENNQRYSNPYKSSQEVYEYYKNIVTDFELTLINKILNRSESYRFSSEGTLY